MMPERGRLNPNDSTAAKEQKHWGRTFKNYLVNLPAEEDKNRRDGVVVGASAFVVGRPGVYSLS